MVTGLHPETLELGEMLMSTSKSIRLVLVCVSAGLNDTLTGKHLCFLRQWVQNLSYLRLHLDVGLKKI